MSEVSCEAGFGLNAHCGSSGSSAPSDSSYQGCAAEPLSAQNDIKTLRSEEGQAGCTGWLEYAERMVEQKTNKIKSRLRMSWCTGLTEVFPQGEPNHRIVHYSLVSTPHA